MKRNKSKSNKKSQDISVWWKVSDWVADLHTEKKQLPAQFKTVRLPDCFVILYILLALIVKISYEVKIFIQLSVCTLRESIDLLIFLS